MPIRKHLRCLVPIFVLALASCAVPPGTAPPAGSPAAKAPAALPELVRPFAEPLARAEVTMEQGTIRSAYGCNVRYELYVPASMDAQMTGAVSTPLVVLTHGFMRDAATVRGWADEWSRRGVKTVVVDLCNSGIFNGRHDRNAEDLVAVADHLEPGDTPRIYAGFSAGGLSALLAGAADPRTVAYLGLDAVDSNGLAERRDRLRAPALFLAGEPTSCNAHGNMLDVLPVANRLLVLRIPHSSHCDFEYPSTRWCTLFCPTAQPPETAEEIRKTIHALATAWIEAYAGVSPESQTVFHRATLDSLVAAQRVLIVRSE
jgi:hypothetical protein